MILEKLKLLKKYCGIYYSFFKASLIADLEYRANFAARIVTDVVWYFAQIMTFTVLFKYRPTIGGWNLQEMNVFLGILFVTDAFFMIILYDNLERFSDKIRKGDLDFLLVKPINSQFMVSFQKLAIAIFGNLLIGTAWLLWSFSKLPNPEPIRLLWLLILIPCSFGIVYSIRFMMSSVALIFTKTENTQFLFYQLYRLSMRPDSIYSIKVRYVLMSVFPFALIASVPARAVLFEANPMLFAWTVAVTIILIYLSTRFWNYCLKFYTSASS